MHFYQTRNITFFIQLQKRFKALVNCRMCNTIMYPSNCSNSMFLQHWLLELVEYMEVPQCGLHTHVLWRLFSAGDQSTQFILPRTQKRRSFFPASGCEVSENADSCVGPEWISRGSQLTNFYPTRIVNLIEENIAKTIQTLLSYLHNNLHKCSRMCINVDFVCNRSESQESTFHQLFPSE